MIIIIIKKDKKKNQPVRESQNSPFQPLSHLHWVWVSDSVPVSMVTTDIFTGSFIKILTTFRTIAYTNDTHIWHHNLTYLPLKVKVIIMISMLLAFGLTVWFRHYNKSNLQTKDINY